MERSFAVGARFGLKRCRWRGLERAEIHELLVATTQNIDILVRNWRGKVRAVLAAVAQRPVEILDFATGLFQAARLRPLLWLFSPSP
jgi:hypothetical protein